MKKINGGKIYEYGKTLDERDDCIFKIRTGEVKR